MIKILYRKKKFRKTKHSKRTYKKRIIPSSKKVKCFEELFKSMRI